MQPNKLSSSIVLFAIVISTLLLLSFLPELSLGEFKLKKISLLADVQPDQPKPVSKISSKKKKGANKKVTKTDPCKKGITCLEDYSKNHNALHFFLKALNETKRKPVRIAFFGDSFIEGDILTASFRDTLQSLFGGKGVGYVPVASEVAQFRTSIQHSYTNWQTYSIVGKKSAWSPLGTPGYCFVPLPDNMVEYRIPKKRNSPSFKKVRLFYTNPLAASLDYIVNDSTHFNLDLPAADSLQQLIINEESIQSIQLTFNHMDSLKAYGLSFEENTGLYVDNLAMRGNSGMGLYQISPEMNKRFNSFQNYKLIILQYGLNVVTENDTLGYDWYIDKMVRVVNRLKGNFPESSILIVSVSDRSSNQNGTFKTIPFIPIMRDAQREIAQKCEVAFWDLYTAMGGENSIIKFTNANPPLAAKDYTHLTFRGGKKIAKKLAETILFERERYAKKKNSRP